jgi:alpha-ketoglutarate-dependent taurine dioxygenase
MTTITTEKLTPTVGAVVEGVDREHLLDDDAFPGWCLEALERNGVLVFPDLRLDDATQVAWSTRLGRVEKLGRGEHPEIFRVNLDPATTPSAAYLRGAFFWHIDGCTEDIPIMATMLSAHVVAETGGETEFASSYAAYDALDEQEKARAESLRVAHTIEASQRLFNHDPSEEEVAMWRRRPAKEHPLVWTHRSGRKSLVLGATADRVVGMESEASRALLDDLLARATAPERVYRHHWSEGDVVIWDNRGVLHRAMPYDADSGRDMHRTTFTGDEAIR